MIVFGVGFASACTADELMCLVRAVRAEAAASVPRPPQGFIATLIDKRGAGVLETVARELELWPRYLSREALQLEQHETTRLSPVAAREVGVGAVAEAAALAVAGASGQLLVPRRQSGRATCAAAISADDDSLRGDEINP